MIVLSIFSFGISYFVFYQLTSKIETKQIKETKSVFTQESNQNTPDKTIMIGNGQGSPSATPNTVVTPDVSGSPSGSPSPSPSVSVVASPTPLPSISVTPSVVAAITPSAKIEPVKILTTPTPIQEVKKKDITFKVRVGAFDSRNDAEKKAKDIESLGYNVLIVDEPEGSYVQVGAFKENDKAVSLAEEISQKGFSVSIRQTQD